MSNWWDEFPVVGGQQAQAPQAPPAPATAPPRVAPPPSAAATIGQGRPAFGAASLFGGLPPEAMLLAGMSGSKEGPKVLAPFLTQSPIEIMGPDGKPVFVSPWQARGYGSPTTALGFMREGRESQGQQFDHMDKNRRFEFDRGKNEFDMTDKNRRFEFDRGKNEFDMTDKNRRFEFDRGKNEFDMTDKNRRFGLDQAKSPVMVDTTGRLVVNPAVVAAGAASAGAEADARVGAHRTNENYTHAMKALTEIEGSADNARIGLANVERLGGLLQQAGSGRFTETTVNIKAMAKGIGIDLNAAGIADNVAPAQAAQALSNALALQLRDPSQGAGMPGALSNADRDYLRAMVPNIANDPGANRIMLDAMKALYQRKLDEAALAARFIQSPEGQANPLALKSTLQKFADENPIFAVPGARTVTAPMPGTSGRTTTATPAPQAGPQGAGPWQRYGAPR